MVPYQKLAQPLDWSVPVRKQSWRTSHLRAARWGLLRNVLKADLFENGQWLKFPEDRILSYPMLEMAGPEHVYCNREILYQYRADNPDCDHRVNGAEIDPVLAALKEKPPYMRKTWGEITAHKTDWL
jgi:hypothetical protein